MYDVFFRTLAIADVMLTVVIPVGYIIIYLNFTHSMSKCFVVILPLCDIANKFSQLKPTAYVLETTDYVQI